MLEIVDRFNLDFCRNMQKAYLSDSKPDKRYIGFYCDGIIYLNTDDVATLLHELSHHLDIVRHNSNGTHTARFFKICIETTAWYNITFRKDISYVDVMDIGYTKNKMEINALNSAVGKL